MAFELIAVFFYRPCPWAALSKVPQGPGLRSRVFLVLLPPEVSMTWGTVGCCG
jgi:hypothetical protein